MCWLPQVRRRATVRANLRQPSFSEAAAYKHVPSAQGRHKHPCPRCSSRCTEQRSPAPLAGWDAKVKGSQRPPGSMTQHSLETSEMSSLTFNGLWMGPRIRALIKIGGQDYYRIKTSLIQMPLALCHSHARSFRAWGKPGEAATKMGSRRAPCDGYTHGELAAWVSIATLGSFTCQKVLGIPWRSYSVFRIPSNAF